MKVWPLTTGDGSNGDEWQLKGIYSTELLALQAKAAYEALRTRSDGSTYQQYDATIEEWCVDPKEGA